MVCMCCVVCGVPLIGGMSVLRGVSVLCGVALIDGVPTPCGVYLCDALVSPHTAYYYYFIAYHITRHIDCQMLLVTLIWF